MSSLNETPRGERIHIALFGRRNVGKSSLVNALAGQNVSIVSDIKGTTTDPVRKAMEILPLGPVEITDTPGLDDEGDLGGMRVKKALEVLDKTDLALLVIDATTGVQPCDSELLAKLQEKNIPHILVANKADLALPPENTFPVSAITGTGVRELREKIASLPLASAFAEKSILEGLVNAGDIVILVTPIDSAAPKGRLILPQQETLRAALDAGCVSLVVRETELAAALTTLRTPPALVITDSQAFAYVSKIVPENIPLTSFSMLFARYKGDWETLLEGANVVDHLQDGDRILIAEACTHHRQKEDIGTVKIPKWLLQKTGKQLIFEHCAGADWPADLAEFALVVHCGGCMLNRRGLLARLAKAKVAGVPVTNYGVLIAKLNGILARCSAPFARTK